METIVFRDKDVIPEEGILKEKIGAKYELWSIIKKYVHDHLPEAKDEWNFPGRKYGWSFRIKDRKRAIVYLIPIQQGFRVGMIFGNKALKKIVKSDISEKIKKVLLNARAYAEGRGIQIDVSNEKDLWNVEKLIDIKLST